MEVCLRLGLRWMDGSECLVSLMWELSVGFRGGFLGCTKVCTMRCDCWQFSGFLSRRYEGGCMNSEAGMGGVDMSCEG